MSQQPTAPSSDRLPSSGEPVPSWLTDDQEFEATLNTLDALLESASANAAVDVRIPEGVAA